MAVRILCVDDEENQRSLISYSLLKKGYDVKVAKDGNEALNNIKEAMEVEYNPFELIILDINMPKMDGFEVVENLKSNKLTQKIPIIFISSSLDEEITNKAIKMGVDDFIYKPLNPDEMYSSINKQLGKNQFDYPNFYIAGEDKYSQNYYQNLALNANINRTQFKNDAMNHIKSDNPAEQILNDIEYNMNIQEKVLEDLYNHTNTNANNNRCQSTKVNYLIQRNIQTFNIKNNLNLNIKFNQNDNIINSNSGIFATMLNYIFNLIKQTIKEPVVEIDIYNNDDIFNMEMYFSLKTGLKIENLPKSNLNIKKANNKNDSKNSSEYILSKTLIHSIGGNLSMRTILEDINLLHLKFPKELFCK